MPAGTIKPVSIASHSSRVRPGGAGFLEEEVIVGKERASERPPSSVCANFQLHLCSLRGRDKTDPLVLVLWALNRTLMCEVIDGQGLTTDPCGELKVFKGPFVPTRASADWPPAPLSPALRTGPLGDPNPCWIWDFVDQIYSHYESAIECLPNARHRELN